MDIANWIASKQAHAMSKKSSDKFSLNPAMSEALLVLDFGINIKYHTDETSGSRRIIFYFEYVYACVS
jgi:hypothetical protein